MRSLIVGTAGHIDHGKSALVRALTGTDPDRLKEEKERGITIDIGFAHLDLGNGLVASFIDVPGHERFVRNMLAGAHGIDVVALVVAADESVMPQTREHFHICRLLGLEQGLVVLTKCDVADADSQALAELETRELVAGSFLEAAPVLRVSARTGQGLEGLKDALRALGAQVAARSTSGLLRLPVDRAFTLRGFGTVVTGTLVSGQIAGGEEVELLPSGRRARVRGLQVHGEGVEAVGAGHRVAVNLAGVEVQDVARGDVVAHGGELRPTSMIDVRVTILPGGRPLADQTRVRVHVASAEVLGRVRTADGGPIAPGASAVAQLRLESKAVAGRGDRLILRSYSPAATIGGALVLDPLPPKRRSRERRSAATTDRGLAGASLAEAAAVLVGEAGPAGLDAATLAARLTVPLGELRSALAGRADLIGLGPAAEPVAFLAAAAHQQVAGSTRAALEAFHRENPLKRAMSREELRRRVSARAHAAAFDHVLAGLAAAGAVRLGADTVSLAGHAVTLSPDEEAGRTALVAEAQRAGLEGLEIARAAASLGKDPRLLDRMARVLQESGQLERVGDGLLVHREHLDALKRRVRERWPPGSRLDVGAFKEMTGLSRKFVIPLLEYLDRERVTRRSGSDRLVLA